MVNPPGPYLDVVALLQAAGRRINLSIAPPIGLGSDLGHSVREKKQYRLRCKRAHLPPSLLVEAGVVQVHRIAPRVVVPDVVGRSRHRSHAERYVRHCSVCIPMKEPVGKVEPLLIRSVPQRARPTTGTGLSGPQIDLRPAVERMTDELLDEVGGGVYSRSRGST